MEDLINREGLFLTFSFLTHKTNVNWTKLIFDEGFFLMVFIEPAL